MALMVAPDHPAYAGHFPGRPLLPGALLLAEVMEAARAEPDFAAALGPTPQLGTAKFLSPVSPGAPLEAAFDLSGGALAFEVRSGARLVASGQFVRADRPAPPVPASAR